jgi:hypothetical protein
MEWELVMCLSGNELHVREPGAVTARCGTWPIMLYSDHQPEARAYMEAHPERYRWCEGCLVATATGAS